MKNQTSWWIWVIAALGLSLLPIATSVAVMSVDMGSEWMKIAIVSPGVPMEIALNKESKRKTPVTIALRNGERTFGEDAMNIGVRFPKLSYSYLLDLLGKRIDHPVVQLFRNRFPYYNVLEDPERHTVLFQHDDNNVYSVEMLLAMLLQKAQEFAQESTNQMVNEAVLTVPGFFNQAERRAMLQVAELAKIKVLQLINDYTAVALNYGIFRRKDFNESPQYIMFYDMGASSTTATVVSYQLVKTNEKGLLEINPQLSILGVGYDRTLGGLEIQLRLRDYLGKKFNELKKTPNDVFKNPRAMAKLFKEAGRLKNILSANAEHHAQVEDLLDDADFKLLVTQAHLEKLCGDVFDRVKTPVEMALKSSGLDLSVISKIILVGAGTRVPKVQELLKEVVGMELGKSINTDEAACMGAVYKSADLTVGFKVKKFITKDAVIFPIQVSFEHKTDGMSSSKLVRRTLFGPMNPYPQKKVLTFNRYHSDFSFNVNYAKLDHLPQNELQALGPQELSHVKLQGVTTALGKHTGSNVESKGVKAHFVMDDSGLLTLANTQLILERKLTEDELPATTSQAETPLSKLGNTISKLFTWTDDKVDNGKHEKEMAEVEEKEIKEGSENGESEKKTESDDESENMTESDGESENKTESDGESENNTESDGESENNTDSDGESENKTESDGDSENKAESDGDSETKAETDGESESKTESDGESENKTESGGEKKEDKADVKKDAMKSRKKKKKKSKVVVIKEQIDSMIEPMGITQMNKHTLRKYLKLIDELNEFDHQRNRRESAMNALESFVFDTQTKLGTEEFLAASTIDETQKIRQACAEVSEWIYEVDGTTEPSVFDEKLKELQGLVQSLFTRVQEHRDRPEVLASLDAIINSTEIFLVNARNMISQGLEDLFTPNELDLLDNILNETKEWKAQKVEEQAALKLSDNPKLKITSIMKKCTSLDKELKYLINKAKTWRPKKSMDVNKTKDASQNETEGEDIAQKDPPEEAIQEARLKEAVQETSPEEVEERETQNEEEIEKTQPNSKTLEQDSNLVKHSQQQNKDDDKKQSISHSEL